MFASVVDAVVTRVRESATAQAALALGTAAAEAALAAGIFHRKEVPIAEVKDLMRKKGIETR